MPDRRDFLKTLTGAAATALICQEALADMKSALNEQGRGRSTAELVKDESFWVPIQRAFDLPPDFINLEHGYFSMMPTSTLETFLDYSTALNTKASYFMRNERLDMLNEVRVRLADFGGCGADEVAITRNTTESMNIVIQGLDLKSGDEVIVGDQDYGSMVEALRFREVHDGIVIKRVEVPLDPESDEEIVSAYRAAITPKTRLLHVTHLINITGHVLPVRKVADMAHERGIDVLCDSAHAFAHVMFAIDDLGVDFMGTSLHKWLCTPLGLGMLYVKKSRIKDVKPLIGRVREPEDIRKLDTLGTQPYAAQQSIPAAIDFHEAIGSELKQERLRYLRNRWLGQVTDHPQIRFNSPRSHARTCAIGNVGIHGMSPRELGDRLWDDYRIFTAPIGHSRVPGVRVSPHLCTRVEEIDQFAAAMLEIAEG